ncbi:penicillin-binding protein [Xinfangfangia sp. D13-10-4-6]|uniref:transglycosylase domain-containing protein n=1 Tax=Pseudogemmobacter hezensis TaxID=2737662 RepID=UPI0015576329|nr:transglycosylase domain-containing protein [Pseudogemmobacter hezensis]NPD16579.1 penicillin-binding protein [Pseudogemmobacter hezensis]
MATSGGGRTPLVADRRYPPRAPAAAAGGRTGGGGSGGGGGGRGKPPQKPAPKRQPKPKRSAARRKHGFVLGTILFFWRMIWGVLWRVTAVGVLIVGSAVAYFYSQLPPLDALLDGRARGSVTMLDRDGKTFAWRGEMFGGQITTENVSPHLVNAIVATEDKRFYWHLGVSPRGIASAIRINLAEGRGAFQGNGGSTITQQVAKLLCLGVPYDPNEWKSEAAYEADCRGGGIKRKLKEVPYAIAMELKYSKKDVLAIYMNRAYLGAGARGFEAAAQRYFGKSAADVTPAEAAMLAGLLQAPSTLAPTSNLQRSQNRANVVVGLMEEQGYLTKAQADEARANPATPTEAARQRSGGYFADWVMETTPDYLARDTTEDVVIETTLDQDLQRKAEEALKRVFDTKVKEGSTAQAAIVVMSSDGAVRAMVGGRAIPRAGDFNRATQALRQTGSAFKPFVYAVALDLGYSPLDYVDDSPYTINVPGSGPYSPKNYDNKFKGMITLVQALKESRNIPAVKISEMVGRDLVKQVASEFGVASKMADGPALALGASESTLIEMTGAYAGILNGGSSVTPYGLRALKLRGENEELFGQGGGIGERVISETAAHALIYMMTEVINSGTGSRARLPDREAAGKTGTTNSARDAWFVGFTSDFVVGVWLGYDDNRPLTGVTGGGLPAEIWREVMVSINQGVPPMPLPKEIPQNTVQNGGAFGPSPDFGGVDRPVMPEEVPYFDGSNAPVYNGGSVQQGAPSSQNQEEIDRAIREAMGMN